MLRTCILPALLLISPGSAKQSGQFVLGPDSNIEIRAVGPAVKELRPAAELLEKYLLQVLHKKNLEGPGRPARFVLDARGADWSDVARSELKDVLDIDAFEIHIETGRDAVVWLKGTSALATAFGVFWFLDNVAGVTWLFPGELGTALPEKPLIRLRPMDRKVRPAFASRIITGLRLRDPKAAISADPFLRRNRHFYLSYDYFKALRLHFLSYSSHNMVNIFPVEKFGQSNPDIFPMKDGKRYLPPPRPKDPRSASGAWQTWHPCYTNPKAAEFAFQKAVEYFEVRKLHCLSLGINDGRRIQCQCPECTRVGFPQSYYQFVQRVADKAKKYYPPHMLGLIAYGDVATPPEDLHLPENVIVVVSSNRPEHLETWSKHALNLGTYEYGYGQGFWVPNFPLKAMQKNAQVYRKYGVRFIHAEMYPIWPHDAPKVYLRARLLWDPDMNVIEGLRRYCRAAFGAGGKAMFRYYTRWADLRDRGILPNGVTPMAPMEVWRKSSRQFAQCSAEDFAACQRALDKAGRKKLTEQQRQRLRMVAVFFDYTHTLYLVYALKERVFNPEVKKDWGVCLGRARDLRQRHKEILAEIQKHPEWLTGTSVTPQILAEWEHHYSWTLNYEMDNALCAAVFHLNQSDKLDDLPEDLGPDLSLYRKPFSESEAKRTYAINKHPWWAKRFPPMNFKTEGTTVRFSVAPRLKPPVTRTPGGGYVVIRVPPLPAQGQTLARLRLDLTGRAGTLDAHLQDRCNGTGRSLGDLVMKFGPEESRICREIVAEPVFLNKKTRARETNVPEGATAILELHLRWTPRDEGTSSLTGRCSVHRIDFED